jgi:hypothetical protein
MENGDSATIVFGHSAAQLRTPITALRARQTQRIRDIRAALIDSGFVSLDQQAAALGLSRSTTWAVLRGNHKCTGLRAALVARMLASPRLPRAAQTILLNYIHEKSQGAYGHNDLQRQRFIAQLELLNWSGNGQSHRHGMGHFRS